MRPSHHKLLLLQLLIEINRKAVRLNASEAVEFKEQGTERIKQSSIITLARLAPKSAEVSSAPNSHWLA
jgi:hypothetical protein